MSSTKPLSSIALGNVVPFPMPLTSATGKGVNETYLGPIETDAGRIKAYIKVLPDKQLVNELVACVLGRSMGFPVPEGFLLQVRTSDIPESDILSQMPNGEGFAFGSRAIEYPPLNRQIQSSFAWGQWFIDTTVFPLWKDLIVFDDWIANSDRHFGNLLISPSNELSWIDHSHCFTGKNWDCAKLQVDKALFNYVANYLKSTLQKGDARKLKDRAAHLSSEMSSLKISELQSASEIIDFLSDIERDTLEKFVTERVGYVEEICAARYGITMLRLV